MEQCGLTDVSRQIIGQLSKGYRQRVGLADALVHEPELIILDEPTIGLDPNQIRSVRQLIKDLAGNHTVLISTHILPEVEMTCSRVVILHEGKILAADTPDNLQKIMSGNSQIIAEIAAPREELQECWEEIAEIEHFDLSAAEGAFFRCALTPRDGMDLRPRHLPAGAGARLAAAGTDAQPAHAGGHLCGVTQPDEERRRRADAGLSDAHAARTGARFSCSLIGLCDHCGGGASDGAEFCGHAGASCRERSDADAGDGIVLRDAVISGSFCWWPAPVITMRLFALEKFPGTFETLMTAPVGDLQVVLAKFTAAMIFYMVMWLPSTACLFIVRHFTSRTRALDAGTVGQHVSGHLSAGRFVHFAGLFCLGHLAQARSRRP